MTNQIEEDIKNRFSHKANGQYREICPACSQTRKKPNQSEPVLSVSIDWPDIKWMCHHCGTSGGASLKEKQTQPENVVKFVSPVKKELSGAAHEYLQERGLSTDTIVSSGVLSSHKFIRSAGKEILCAGFPYIDPTTDKTYAVKWRGVQEKGFTQEGAASTFYGIEKIKIGQPIVICEGEVDQLSLKESGVLNAVSVPNGAPMKVRDGYIDPSEDRKFSYIFAADEILKNTEKVIIAVDGDVAGKALGEELARRIGKVKCYSVKWPSDCKDANDTLLQYGKAKVANCIDEAEPWPIAGLFGVKHYADKVRNLYQKGEQRGFSTGYANVDSLFTIKTGVYLITGIPSHGKSEFLDQILFNLSQKYDLKHAVCSFENPPEIHLTKMLERIILKKFGEDNLAERMSKDEMERGLDWLNDHFIFMEQSDGTSGATIDDILDRASSSVSRIGSRTLTIDPYNYISMNLGSKSETNQISEMLSKVRNWALAHDSVVFFVAHPAKLYRENGKLPVPRGYDVIGSSVWYAKTDVGITVFRNAETDLVEIHVWKVRFKHIGKQGMTELSYDIPTGVYREAQENWTELSEKL